MTRTIWKFSVPVDDQYHAFDIPSLPVPGGIRMTGPNTGAVLHVDCQISSQQVEFWVLVDTDQPTVRREFIVVGTGQPLPGWTSHVGTAKAGMFMWHLLEKHGLR